MAQLKQTKLAPDAWVIVALGQILTTVKLLNQIGADKITPARFTTAIRGFKGPQALGAPSLQCGKYKTEPAACNDQAQFFQYEGKGVFKRAQRLAAAARQLHAPGLGARSDQGRGRRDRPRPADLARMDWNQILLFALLGLGTGALIAGIAIGLVLTYRGSGVINLATGAIAMLAGYSYWSLKTGQSRLRRCRRRRRS